MTDDFMSALDAIIEERSLLKHPFYGFDAACREGTVAQGLAALYAYESQAPAVAEAKIEGLRRFYSVEDASNYAFFSVHRELDVEHSGAERAAVVAAATDETARRGLEEATRSAAGHLWRFLDGAYAGSCN